MFRNRTFSYIFYSLSSDSTQYVEKCIAIKIIGEVSTLKNEKVQ